MKKFKSIYVEITNICNLNCSFCSQDNLEKKSIKLAEFEHILKEINDYTDYIYLHVKGEPLLHQNLKEILDLCKKYNKQVNLTTNGTLLKNSKDILLNSKVVRQINISLHSENNKEHYLDEIFDVTKQLAKDIIIVYRFWTLKNLKLNTNSTQIVEKIIDNYNLSTDIVDKIYNEENIKIANNIYISKDNLFVWPDLNNSYYNEQGYCHALKTHIAILVDGTVIPCCLDSKGIINLGNIYQEKFSDILNKQRTINIRNNFNNRRCSEELCKHCSFKERFDK